MSFTPVRSQLQIAWPDANSWALLQRLQLSRRWLRAEIDQLVQRELGSSPPLEALAPQVADRFLMQRQALQKLVLSVLQLSDAELAQELYFRIKSGEADFSDLSPHSLGSEQHTLGRVGPLEFGTLSPVLQAMVQRCTGSQIHPPVETDNGDVLLMRVERRIEAQLDDALRKRLAGEIYESWCQRLLNQHLNDPPQDLQGAAPLQIPLQELLQPHATSNDG
jgi:hypothetical protein